MKSDLSLFEEEYTDHRFLNRDFYHIFFYLEYLSTTLDRLEDKAYEEEWNADKWLEEENSTPMDY